MKILAVLRWNKQRTGTGRVERALETVNLVLVPGTYLLGILTLLDPHFFICKMGAIPQLGSV